MAACQSYKWANCLKMDVFLVGSDKLEGDAITTANIFLSF